VLVGYSWHGGAVECQVGGPGSSSSIEVLSLWRVSDKVVLDVARRRDAHRNMCKVRGMQVSSSVQERPEFVPPIAVAASSLRLWLKSS
jgi:hypothetical protein